MNRKLGSKEPKNRQNLSFERGLVLNFLYPPLCLHCDAFLEKGKKLFCSLCLEQLTLLDPMMRCLTCFAEKPPAKKCVRCCTRISLIKRQAAAYPCFGAANTLAFSLKKGHEQRTDAVASLLALQWVHLSWPLPDCVTALPLSTLARLRCGCDYNALLAKQMARHCERPYIPLLKAHFDTQSFLTTGAFTTRYTLIEKNKKQVRDARVLMVSLELDDLPFRAAASLLQSACAKEIYTLAFIDSFCSSDNV